MFLLFPSDRILLKALKDAQQDESHYFVIDNGYIYRCNDYTYDAVQNAIACTPIEKIKIEHSSFDSCLASLQEQGFISKAPSGSVMKVTHKGWNASFLQFNNILEAFCIVFFVQSLFLL